MELSLIIPAHNEEERLAPTLALYVDALRGRYGSNCEVIVVANACADGTVRIAREAAAVSHQVRVLDIAEAVGKGGAVLAGFREARGARVLFADADAATAPASLLDLADGLELHDVVIGSRRLRSSTITRPQRLSRRVLGHGFAITVRALFGLSFRDTQCGAKAFRRDAARRLAGLVQESGWAFDVDLLVSARQLGLTVAETPIVWGDRQGSRLRLLATAAQVSTSLWRLKHRQILAPLTQTPGVDAPARIPRHLEHGPVGR